VADVQPLDEVVDASLATRRYQMKLFVVFGLVAMAIALVGVYGVTASTVLRRRREMNIRVALGAQRTGVVALVVRQAALPIAAGLAAGIAGALVAGSLIAALLFDVRSHDPLTVVSVVSTVGMAGLLASLLAARLNLSLDPASALREE